jgi:hypothetical protein
LNTLEEVFLDVTSLFEGEMKGFHKCDTLYHNIQHTQETALVSAQIMDGWNRSGNLPIITAKPFQLGIIAALFHDVGYIKRQRDNKGTGAKYTFRHIKRSVEFAKQYLSSNGYSKNDISSVQNMIWCTCSQRNLSNLKYSDKGEELAGFSLGTADLLAQMSAADYLKKLTILFQEFSEAYKYEGMDKLRQEGYKIFNSVDELIKNTPYYYESWVKKRLKEMNSVYQFITFHYGDGRNYCTESITKNLKKVKSQK